MVGAGLVFFPGLVMWDEASYIWEGYRIHEALRTANFLEFFRLSKSQFYYPFFQSWYLGITTLPFSYTAFSVRLVSLFLLLPTVWLLWVLTEKISKGKIFPAVLVVFLFLTSPLILFYYSTAMKEGLGTVLTLLVFWLYCNGCEAKPRRSSGELPLRRRRSSAASHEDSLSLRTLGVFIFRARQQTAFLKKKRPEVWFFLTGITALILTLTKYNYGVLVLMALGLESLCWRRWKENLAMFLPVIFGLGIWLSRPGRPEGFLLVLQNRFTIHLHETTVLGHLLYYPLELAFGYFFSPLICLLVAAGFIYGLKNWRDFRVRLLVLIFLINFILAERHMGNNQARFIFTSFPGFLIVGCLGLTELFFKIKPLFRRWFLLGVSLPVFLVGGGVILKDLFALPKILRPTASHQCDTAIFYETDQAKSWRYDFTRENWPHAYSGEEQETVEDIFDFIFANVNLSKKFTPLNFTNEISPGLFSFNFALAQKAKKGTSEEKYSEYFVVLEIEEGSKFDTIDFRRANLGPMLEAKKFLTNPSFVKIAQKRFPTLGLTAHILAF